MKSIQLMLLEIGIMLLGGIILLDPSSDLGGFELTVVIAGFIVILVGFTSKESQVHINIKTFPFLIENSKLSLEQARLYKNVPVHRIKEENSIGTVTLMKKHSHSP